MYAHLSQISFVAHFFRRDGAVVFSAGNFIHSLSVYCKVGWLSCFLCFAVISLLCLCQHHHFRHRFFFLLLLACFIVLCESCAENMQKKDEDRARGRESKANRTLQLFFIVPCIQTYLWSGRNRYMDYMTFGCYYWVHSFGVHVGASSFFLWMEKKI